MYEYQLSQWKNSENIGRMNHLCGKVLRAVLFLKIIIIIILVPHPSPYESGFEDAEHVFHVKSTLDLKLQTSNLNYKTHSNRHSINETRRSHVHFIHTH